MGTKRIEILGTFYGAPTPETPSDGQYMPPRQVSWGWIGESWLLFTQAAGIWMLGVLFFTGLSFLLGLVMEYIFRNPGYVPPVPPFHADTKTLLAFSGYGPNSPLTPIGQVINFTIDLCLSSYQYACLYRMAVKQMRAGPLKFGDIFSGGRIFFNMLVYSVVASIASSFGICFLGLGAIVAWALFLPGWALIAEGESVSRSISRSFESMKRDWPSATLFLIGFGLIIVASALPCGLGLFATMPMLYLISALAYRDMIGFPAVSGAAGAGYDAAPDGVWPPPPRPVHRDPNGDKNEEASTENAAPPRSEGESDD